MTTIATKKRRIYFSNEIGKMQLRSVASDWQRWQLKQKFAIVDGKTKAVDVNPSLSATQSGLLRNPALVSRKTREFRTFSAILAR